MISHKDCTHPATTLGRRSCPLRKLAEVDGDRKFPKEPPANATPRWKPERTQVVEDESKVPYLKQGKSPMTVTAYKELPSVYAHEMHKPLVRVNDHNGSYEVIGRDQSGNLVRAYAFDWEDTHGAFSALPLRRLAD